MSRFDGQQPESLIPEADVEEAGVRMVEDHLADADLDGDLPERSRADQDLVVGVVDQSAGGCAQLRVVQRIPDQRVRIQEWVQGMYSAKSFR